MQCCTEWSLLICFMNFSLKDFKSLWEKNEWGKSLLCSITALFYSSRVCSRSVWWSLWKITSVGSLSYRVFGLFLMPLLSPHPPTSANVHYRLVMGLIHARTQTCPNEITGCGSPQRYTLGFWEYGLFAQQMSEEFNASQAFTLFRFESVPMF